MNMIALKNNPSDQRKSALIGGIALLLMALAAAFSYGIAHGSLVVKDDALATWNNLQASSLLFKGEILGWIFILICDVVVAWALYLFFQPFHRPLSLLAAWLRLIYAALLGTSILNLLLVLLLTNSSSLATALDHVQLEALNMLFLQGFDMMWSAGLLVFGAHLLVVGYLVLIGDSIPNLLGYLLLLAAIGYIIIHLCTLLLPSGSGIVTLLESILTVPMMIGELGLAFWLISTGLPKRRKQIG